MKKSSGVMLQIIMKISDEHLDKFIELYKDKYGETLSREEAYEEGSRLMRLIEIVESNAYKVK